MNKLLLDKTHAPFLNHTAYLEVQNTSRWTSPSEKEWKENFIFVREIFDFKPKTDRISIDFFLLDFFSSQAQLSSVNKSLCEKRSEIKKVSFFLMKENKFVSRD